MTKLATSPHMISLMKDLKPFLGPRGRRISDMCEVLLEILESEQVHRAQQSLNALLAGETYTTLPVEEEDKGTLDGEDNGLGEKDTGQNDEGDFPAF